MLRRAGFWGALLLLVCGPCFGQEWARKMFKVTDHNYGSVARDAKAEYQFVFENLYVEDIHIAGVQASCGCTSVWVTKPLLKTYEKAAIVAHFNTDRFQGQRGATITVTIDRPYYAQVQLQVSGFIRTDVMIQPGSVQLGTVDQGTPAEQSVAVQYTGGGDWQITAIKSSNPHISAQAVETGRNYGQISYALKVRVDKTAPAGYLNDHLMLVTNDAQGEQIPVPIEGRVLAGITVSPTSLFMGVVRPGQKVTKQLVVKGKKPFRILSVTCDDKSFVFDTSANHAAKAIHLIPVTFAAGTDAGKVAKTIKIKTDQGEMMPELAAYAVVAAAR
jgi:hypothetical protein